MILSWEGKKIPNFPKMLFFFWWGLWKVCTAHFGSSVALQCKQRTSSHWPLWTEPAASHNYVWAWRSHCSMAHMTVTDRGSTVLWPHRSSWRSLVEGLGLISGFAVWVWTCWFYANWLNQHLWVWCVQAVKLKVEVVDGVMIWQWFCSTVKSFYSPCEFVSFILVSV